mmetsp:Transcript_2351/g.7102  ORF Transcript_2351/g.7102 Transcript_2351/m.7102 type:complete len:242 (-) Transcript_2351:27-752(-)
MPKRKAAADSDSDSVVDLTEEAEDVKPRDFAKANSSEDVKPVAPEPYVHDIDAPDAGGIVAPSRRGLKLQGAALPWVYATQRSPCAGSNAVFSRVILLAQRFDANARALGHSRILLADSEVIRRGAVTHFLLRGAAIDDDDLRKFLGLELTLGPITLPVGDQCVPIMIDGDGNVETRFGQNMRKLGTIDGEAKLCLWLRPPNSPIPFSMSMHPQSLRYEDVDGRTLLETGPLDFDVAAGAL